MTTITREQITPEYVAGLYKKHNLYPTAFHFLLRSTSDGLGTCCCGLGVIAVETGGPKETSMNDAWVRLKRDLGEKFVGDFMAGFDDGMMMNSPYNSPNNTQALGQACARAAVGKRKKK